MSISDLIFVFFFMPVFFGIYAILPPKRRRWALALGGIFFYAWGNLSDALILLVLSAVVYVFSRLSAKKKLFAFVGIACCVLTLAVFKYVNTPLGFPLGASFYIFHMISYLADIHRGETEPADFVSFLAYIAMFPKLIMGPIVQYHDIAETIKAPAVSVNETANGLFRFIVGLSKKAAIAMQLAPLTESLWADAANSALSAWLGAICFSLQLYFDFSSYSDMAIGLGRMAGFSFGENFIYPYISCSVSEFYRRWHASLGRWFRDYLYIPLGGSRKGLARTLLNLMIVWAATGIWHGSTLNFLGWGIGLGAIICFEKLTGIAKGKKTFPGWLWTTVLIVVSWVIFNSADMPSAALYISRMFGASPFVLTQPLLTVLHDSWYVPAIAVFGCTPLIKNCCQKVFKDENSRTAMLCKSAALCALLALSLLLIVNSGYSAFIYTKF